MQIQQLNSVAIDAIYSCVPKRSEDNLARCIEIYGDEKKALSVVKATGIKSRRVVDAGTSSLDLCACAAERLLADLGVAKEEIGAVIDVTFTPERTMPCNACQAQYRLGLPTELIAFDINLACSGWVYGLYMAGLLAKSTQKKVLFLDGDVQTKYINPADQATVPVLADAGTATLISPIADGGRPWKFAFMTQGEKGDALQFPIGGSLTMDGLGVFKFVTMDVLYFIRDFMAAVGETPETMDAFVPHQANIFMIQQIAKKLKFPAEKLWISGDVLGNSSSATIPTTIAHCMEAFPFQDKALRHLLISGFGGGLSAAVGTIDVSDDCCLKVFDYE